MNQVKKRCALSVGLLSILTNALALTPEQFIQKFGDSADLLFNHSSVVYEYVSELGPSSMRLHNITAPFQKSRHLIQRNGERCIFAEEFNQRVSSLNDISTSTPQVFINAYDGVVTRYNNVHGDFLTSYSASKSHPTRSIINNLSDLPTIIAQNTTGEADGSITAGTGGASKGYLDRDFFAEGYYKKIGLTVQGVAWSTLFKKDGFRINRETATEIEVQVPTSTVSEWLAAGVKTQEEAERRTTSNYFVVKVDPSKDFRVTSAQLWYNGDVKASLKDVELSQDQQSGIWYPSKFTLDMPGKQILSLRVLDFSAAEVPGSTFAKVWSDKQKVKDSRDNKLYRFVNEKRVEKRADGSRAVLDSDPDQEALTWAPEQQLEVVAKKINLMKSN